MNRWLLWMFLLCLPGPLWALDTEEIKSIPETAKVAHQYDDPLEAVARVPAFVTDSRIDQLIYYPCENCHTKGMVAPNDKVRTLELMHMEINLDHGKGRFWCTTCHDINQRNQLISLKKQRISFDQPYLLCGQCHFARQRDFFQGAHGKRKDNWFGPKKLTNCTECHDPHVPQIRARLPRKEPDPRLGLSIDNSDKHHRHQPWDQAKEEHKDEVHQ
ncbi:MAG: hypothetical protein A2527_09680 [Candidatus Lambdaproteobacteria bacterium RIFOXYD2_FULL_50_16]|uniref:Cytochrome c7-like domain-containing protein n=1 Tax=Candidatus Lambdaproteobacteria bacterium RIFOXYD2_FULL_50_16 TaxID=1817772 RepID=A0A1F6G7N6_9PROT|nr:MAG: hypothetical protein A2527_09680 [Candidatus Lambdaproteobacteria bacterium RIFOXYD2_FULL_50_16]